MRFIAGSLAIARERGVKMVEMGHEGNNVALKEAPPYVPASVGARWRDAELSGIGEPDQGTATAQPASGRFRSEDHSPSCTVEGFHAAP